MISLLRRNRKKNAKQQRPLTRSLISDQLQQAPTSLEIYNDNSLDSLVFAASLGLISTHHPQQPPSPKDLMLVMEDAEAKQQPPLEFHCRFCGKGYRWKSTMRRHETLECGDKPPSFSCEFCPYRARQRGNLTVHLKRHHQKN
ncbi:hypothetical protein QAD02_022608 [Eretmocerus hayati]|uniref:Uncharacterized protein n=1 Tax=Eretmocerus hayati TaxID=131215 RepID=A0ACC2PTA3_9HYME|nr:hypothetical protein QAD02_022608 [Eretmocerus hayati]